LRNTRALLGDLAVLPGLRRGGGRADTAGGDHPRAALPGCMVAAGGVLHIAGRRVTAEHCLHRCAPAPAATRRTSRAGLTDFHRDCKPHADVLPSRATAAPSAELL